MTPFQKALLESTASQFDNVPEEAEIDIVPTPQFTREAQHIGKQHRLRKTLRRVGLVAVVFVLLVGTVLAGKLFPDWGKPEMSQFSMHMEDGSENVHIRMDFNESFVSPDAPENIETFYMPTLEVSPENVVPGSCFVEYSGGGAYYPFLKENDPYEGNIKLDKEIFDTLFCWDRGYDFLTYSQIALNNDRNNGIQWVHSKENEPQYETKTIEVDGYDVFCVAIHSTYGTTHIWFWTDGDYLFSLQSGQADMTDLLRSMQPMEDMSPYLEPDLPFHTLP